MTDDLRGALHKWTAPETPSSLDARVLESFRRCAGPPWWRRLISAKIEVPVPVFAAGLIVLAAAVWLARTPPPQRAVMPPEPAVVVTTLDVRGFRPLPEGEIKLVRKGVRQ